MTTQEVKPIIRIRANISTSVKGQRTYDATVELTAEYIGTQGMRLHLLAELDALTKALDERCPRLEA